MAAHRQQAAPPPPLRTPTSSKGADANTATRSFRAASIKLPATTTTSSSPAASLPLAPLLPPASAVLLLLGFCCQGCCQACGMRALMGSCTALNPWNSPPTLAASCTTSCSDRYCGSVLRGGGTGEGRRGRKQGAGEGEMGVRGQGRESSSPCWRKLGWQAAQQHSPPRACPAGKACKEYTRSARRLPARRPPLPSPRTAGSPGGTRKQSQLERP